MDSQISKYWGKVAAAREQLRGDQHYMCSIETDGGGRAGVVSVMNTEAAARAIARGIARLATKAEIDAEKARNVEARAEIERSESARLRSHLFAPTFVDPTAASKPEPAKGDDKK